MTGQSGNSGDDDDRNNPIRQGRPTSFDDRKDLPHDPVAYRIRRDGPGVIDRIDSWANDTDPTYRYIGITSDAHDRMREHENTGVYDSDKDRVEILHLKDDADWNELRSWEQDQIREKRPVLNDSNHPGGQGRTPDDFRSCVAHHSVAGAGAGGGGGGGGDYYEDDDDDEWVPCCTSCEDVDYVSGPDDDDDWYCSRCDEYIDEDGDVVDYDDDDDDDDDDDRYECRYCGNYAARDCSSGSCGVCCSGCDRHGW